MSVMPVIATALAASGLGPDQLWARWHAPAPLVLALILVAGGYAHGSAHLGRRGGRRRVHPTWRVAAFATGMVLTVVALLSPLDALAHELLTAHMVQHLLLLVAIPVAVVLGRPSLPLLAAVHAVAGPRWRGAIHRLRLPLRWRRVLQRPGAAALAWAVHIVAVGLWHIPGAYEAALRHPLLHALEHATMLGTALVAWWAVLRPGSRRTRGAAVLYVSAAAIAGGLLAALLALSGSVWYPTYAITAPAWGLSGLEDQQLAGALMWVAGGALYVGVGAALFARWIATLDAPGGRARRHAARTGAGWSAALAAVAVLGGACTVGEEQVNPEAVRAVDRGREALLAYGCVGCHQVPGVTTASGLMTTQGAVGPPLAGIAERQVIAGILPNTPENLVRWIRSPQDIDPGNVMPDLGVSEEDAADIAAYLGTLR